MEVDKRRTYPQGRSTTLSDQLLTVPLFTLGILCAFFIITFGNYDNTFHVQPNANFTVMWLSAGKPTSVMLGNMSVPQGDRSNPCKVGEFCWQLLSAVIPLLKFSSKVLTDLRQIQRSRKKWVHVESFI
nr:unnamed protein product [Spirometra erinaceieuropaei]